jgi:flagellar hook assembly protein FlgD
VSFRIYNVRGQLVRTLLDDTRPAGETSIAWDGVDDAGARVAAGMYFYRGEVGGTHFDQKLVMVK